MIRNVKDLQESREAQRDTWGLPQSLQKNQLGWHLDFKIYILTNSTRISFSPHLPTLFCMFVFFITVISTGVRWYLTVVFICIILIISDAEYHFLCLLDICMSSLGFPGGSVVKNLPDNAGDTGNAGSVSGLGWSPGVGNGNPLQYSCLENPMDRGAWQATVHGVAKSQTWLSTHANVFLAKKKMSILALCPFLNQIIWFLDTQLCEVFIYFRY